MSSNRWAFSCTKPQHVTGLASRFFIPFPSVIPHSESNGKAKLGEGTTQKRETCTYPSPLLKSQDPFKLSSFVELPPSLQREPFTRGPHTLGLALSLQPQIKKRSFNPIYRSANQEEMLL